MNAGGREHVHAAAQQIFQVLPKTDEVEQRPIRFHVHEEIKVTVRTRFPASLGPEDADVPGTVFVGDTEDVLTTPFEVCHGASPRLRLTYGEAGSQPALVRRSKVAQVLRQAGTKSQAATQCVKKW
jgi:hypothetical protein